MWHDAEAGVAELTHFDQRGRARMVDVSAKPDSAREAIAKGEVLMQPETLAMIKEGRMAKGDVLAVAQVAGIMGAKRTSDIIPMCHPLPLTSVGLDFDLDVEHSRVLICATAKTVGKTGVEMEALTAVAVAALTIYDMCKAVDRGMKLGDIRLARKSGGKSGGIELE
jgi:cyclic pyranopterin phosphate synthase